MILWIPVSLGSGRITHKVKVDFVWTDKSCSSAGDRISCGHCQHGLRVCSDYTSMRTAQNSYKLINGGVGYKYSSKLIMVCCSMWLASR